MTLSGIEMYYTLLNFPERNGQAEYIAAKAGRLVARPAKVSREAAGSVFMVGSSAAGTVQVLEELAVDRLQR